MKVKHWKEGPNWFREIVSRNYAALRKLEAEYNKISKKTWLNCYDVSSGEWLLTIAMGEKI